MMTTAPPNTSTATVKRPRIVGVDALRVLCLIAVIFGHTYGATIEHREFLSMWRMPLFFVLSGYFLTPGKSLRAETNTRFTTLLVPYFWWSVICSVVTVIWWYHDPKHLTELLIMGWYGGVDQTIIWMAFWFLSVLTATVMLYRCLQHLPAWVPWAVALSGLVLSDILDDELLARTPFSVGLCLPVLFYILCGRALHMLVHTRLQATIGTERPSTPYALIGSGLVVAGFIATALGVPTHSIQSSDFGLFLVTPLTGITISAGFILLSATWGGPSHPSYTAHAPLGISARPRRNRCRAPARDRAVATRPLGPGQPPPAFPADCGDLFRCRNSAVPPGTPLPVGPSVDRNAHTEDLVTEVFG
ncbi:acyltransferase family protein [Auritidibacter sp. NML100628]|uniref:acyltransferase family protein n=1 Tax=Auritidibacter sp. NML100628 TaxID=2170742 RepID=UPI0011B27881|nr:acyltransferase [Auritidibacter sp. NML100628]